ncbi:MAG: hypothetical protein COB81_03795 [Flavobacteriaceae bacterium]|nr:hypothetical protein [Robiginitomaculum sp.]PCI03556.1 MAG: hypothetical protein COB81_03795 [Flavobacteriaceae bacterium]
MELNLSESAQIAEIISAFAIVLSLFFVGFQLRDNVKATRSATANSSIASLSAWYAGLGLSEQASANYYTGITNPDALPQEEWVQFVMGLHAAFLNFQNSYYLAAEGTLDHEIRNSLTAAIAAVKGQPGFLRYWQQRKPIFFPEFQDYVDLIVASDQVNSEGVYKKIEPVGATP